MGHIVFLDKCFIGCVKQDERVVGEGIIHPFLQLRFGEGSARRIVRIAEVNDVDALVRNFGNEVVGGSAGHVGYVAPLAVLFQYAGTSAHHVAVNIYGIDGIGDPHTVVMAEDVADVSRIAFRPVVDEYFLRAEMNAARCVIVFNDGINQKVVSLFGAVSMKCLGVGHLVHCLVHRLDAGLRQWAGNVSDTQTDDVLLGVRYPESIDLFGYVREQITARQL